MPALHAIHSTTGSWSEKIEPTTAGFALLVGLTVFWVYRLFAQLFMYDRRLWIGNRLHTIVHAVFTVIWCYLSGVFGWALWNLILNGRA